MEKLVFSRPNNCLVIADCTRIHNFTLQHWSTQLSRRNIHCLGCESRSTSRTAHICQILMKEGGVNTHPQTEEAVIYFFVGWLLVGLCFFKLGLANVKSAIITMLQLHRKHNLGNSSGFTSAYSRAWFAATVSHCCYSRRCRGFPGAAEQGARHAEPYHRQGGSTPQPPGAKPDACHHRSPHPRLWPASIKEHVPREGHTEGPSGKGRNDGLHETFFQSLRISPK